MLPVPVHVPVPATVPVPEPVPVIYYGDPKVGVMKVEVKRNRPHDNETHGEANHLGELMLHY